MSSETVETVETDAGDARVTWHRAKKARFVLAVGHGAGGGIDARDLQALAAVLPGHGVTVALVEQPWRVAGKKVASAPRTLDVGWRGIWAAVAKPGLPVISGGRSAGARVACRTAAELGAVAVLALSFPLHPPGKPEKSRAANSSGPGCPRSSCRAGTTPSGDRRSSRRATTSWSRCRTPIMGSPCPSGRRSGRTRRWRSSRGAWWSGLEHLGKGRECRGSYHCCGGHRES